MRGQLHAPLQQPHRIHLRILAVTDNTEDLIKRLRRLSQRGTALKLRAIINSLECNNQYIGNFAKTYNAQNTYTYLDRYTNRSNKKLESKITINDIAYEQGKEKQESMVVFAGNQ